MRLPAPLRVINEGLAFLLELAALAALAWWGWRTSDHTAVRLLAAVATPGAAAVLWGLFAAPRARFAVPLPAVLLVKALVFGSAVAALLALGQRGDAVTFGAVLLVNTVLVTVDRRGAARAAAGRAG
ncbi:YrdB family protein [Streptomyces sp. NPDC090025]|uniref:YrdB family protein n=1 Tax=Streptomyces sp. NPDC090025 TaxID=3365922 RepID=UPI003839B950